MDYILPGSPVKVSATGVGHVSGASENLAYVTAFYDSSLIAHLNVNWLSPVKVRRTLIGGSRQMIVYDDIETSEKIKVYDKGIEIRNGGLESYGIFRFYYLTYGYFSLPLSSIRSIKLSCPSLR